MPVQHLPIVKAYADTIGFAQCIRLEKIKVIKTRDTFSLFGPACDGWVQCRPSDQRSLLTRVVLTKVAQFIAVCSA
jgi:hypothetical protein